jgi:chaperone modulatory protein CbpM
MSEQTILSGIIVEESEQFTLGELSRACGRPTEWILALVAEGIIEPVGDEQRHWYFCGSSLRRVRIVERLQSDLDLNLSGAALALELLEEVQELRHRIATLEN